MLSPRALLAILPEKRRRAVRDAARRLRLRSIEWALSYSTADLQAALRALGVQDGDALVMHSAFRPTNGFTDDPQHLIDGILDVIGPRGHLIMMSMPYAGASRDYLAAGTVFDVRRTPSQMGVVTESFRRRKGVKRSANPLHPVLAWGPRAEWLVEGHEFLPHSCGQGSPFHKMLELDAKALFFDVDVEYLTFTHYLEDLFRDTAPVPVYSAVPVAADLIDHRGERLRVPVYPFTPEAMRARNFAVVYDAMLARGLVARGRAGNTILQVLSLSDLVRLGAEQVASGAHIYDASGAPVAVKPTRRGSLPDLLVIVKDEVTTRRAYADASRAIRSLLAPIDRWMRARRRTAAAAAEARRDHEDPLPGDPGADACATAAIEWLAEAQDRSASRDGGLAHHYSLFDGWSTSYPETTGYAIPTLLAFAERTGEDRHRIRARRMLDWLCAIQRADGSFPSGVMSAPDSPSCTFNTGQILLGLAAGARTFDEAPYRAAMRRAADWLVETQDVDGCWRAFPSPFASPGDKTYDTHVAWGLFEAARVVPEAAYAALAMRNVQWALTHQRANGWFGRGCMSDSTQPLTHAIGYTLRGVIEAYRFTSEVQLLERARLTADALIRVAGTSGVLPGRLRSDWSPAVPWSCLTGLSQIAHCWLLLFESTGQEKYLRAATRANQHVRRTMHLTGSPGVRGGVKGSFPVDGGYCAYEFPNWAAKFTVDANLAEVDALRRRAADGEPAVGRPSDALNPREALPAEAAN